MADKSRFDHDLFFSHKFPEAPYTYTERETELVRRDHFLLSLNHPLNILRFSRPISHGLCTLGFAVRAIIKCICRGDAHIVKNISGRFLLHVYPGETSITEMWLQGLRIIYQAEVKDRNQAVLSGLVDLHRLTSSL